MVHPKRFELLTPRFVVWCSIQLSYGRACREGGRTYAGDLQNASAGLAFSPPGKPRAGHRHPSLIYSTAERRSWGAARIAGRNTAFPFEAATRATFRWDINAHMDFRPAKPRPPLPRP